VRILNRRIYEAFDSVRAEDELKRRTKEAVCEKIQTTSPKRATYRKRLAAVCACLFLLLAGFGGYQFYMAPVSTISVDVNPSIELEVNRLDKIVAVNSYNEDGQQLADSVNLKNYSYSDALDVLMSSDAMCAYLEQGEFVSITVIGSTEAKSEEMLAQISSCKYASRQNVSCQYGDKDDLAAAHEVGLSCGKYRAFLELQAFDPSVTAADVQGMTMKQIYERINAFSGSSGNVPSGNGNGFNGGGNGQHHGGK
jgi:hypothetical protein